MFYGWRVAGAAFLAWAISIGPRQAFSVFLLAFLEEFGWGRSVTAAAFSVHMSFYALGGCALGVLLDRFGPRRVIALSTAAWVGILVLCSRIETLWQLYLIYGVLGGVATGGLAQVPNNAIISRWFVRYRGFATGISQAGVPAGANPPVFASFLTDRLQGPRLGFLLGLQNIGFGAGAILGPVLAGALFDWLGSYTLAFHLSATTALGSAAIISIPSSGRVVDRSPV